MTARIIPVCHIKDDNPLKLAEVRRFRLSHRFVRIAEGRFQIGSEIAHAVDVPTSISARYGLPIAARNLCTGVIKAVAQADRAGVSEAVNWVRPTKFDILLNFATNRLADTDHRAVTIDGGEMLPHRQESGAFRLAPSLYRSS